MPSKKPRKIHLPTQVKLSLGNIFVGGFLAGMGVGYHLGLVLSGSIVAMAGVSAVSTHMRAFIRVSNYKNQTN